jgi:hypothetical protein
MQLLYSNTKPCEYDNSSFSEAFENGVVSSDSVKIATGYITEDSLLELKSIFLFYFEEKKTKTCSLVIGMHGREGFTRAQYDAAIELATFLKENDLGSVRVCTAFKYHGKTYVFGKSGVPAPVSAMLGSSNLGNILDSRQYEVDALFTEEACSRSSTRCTKIWSKKHRATSSRCRSPIISLKCPTCWKTES